MKNNYSRNESPLVRKYIMYSWTSEVLKLHLKPVDENLFLSALL